MAMTITATTPGGQRHKMRMHAGQTAKFGGSAWADFSFPSDPALAELHFSIECTPAAMMLRDLSGAAVRLNQQAVAAARLNTGDTVQAGNTRFEIEIDGQSRPTATTTTTTVEETTEPAPPDEPQTLAAVCESLQLPQALPAANLSAGGEELVARLASAGLHYEAIRLQAHILEPAAAVAWGCKCLREITATRQAEDKLSEEDTAAIDAAAIWATSPGEDERYAAQAAAEQSSYETGASWLALAAFWSGPSLLPADEKPLPPGMYDAGHAIAGALSLEATRDAQTAAAWYARFLQLA